MIKLTYPDYYDKFACIADKCELTCCAAWEVVVDRETETRYRNEKSSIGEKLRECMIFDGEDTIFRPINGRCPFLDGKNLCEIYKALGEQALCRTCTKYPRFDTDFGGRKELGLSVSCPTAAQLILCGEDFPEYLIKEINAEPEMNSTDPELYFSVMSARKHILNIIRTSETIPSAFDEILEFSGKLQKLMNSEDLYNKTEKLMQQRLKPKSRTYGNYLKELVQLEQLSPDTHALICEKINDAPDFNDQAHMLKRLFEYYIYRYFSSAVFDKDVLSPVGFAVFSVACVAAMLRENPSERDVINTAAAYSREVEHSQKNLDKIKQISRKL